MISRGREELPAVVALLAHLQEQALVHLRQRKHMGVVDRVAGQAVNSVADIAQIPLGVDPHPLDAGHDFADDLLTRRCVGPIAEALEVRDQLAVDELQHLALGQHLLAALAIRRGPVAPAVG